MTMMMMMMKMMRRRLQTRHEQQMPFYVKENRVELVYFLKKKIYHYFQLQVVQVQRPGLQADVQDLQIVLKIHPLYYNITIILL